MINLYIFDMGGVVTVDKEQADGGVATREAGEDLDALVIGAIEPKEFLRRLAARMGTEIAGDLLTWSFRPEPDRDVLALIDTLKKHTRVVFGTNTIAPHFDIHLRNGDYDAFDAVYASHLIGMAKPNPAFYLHIIGREKRSPAETVFVDDREANVEAARKIGMHGFLFRDAAQLAGDLAALPA